MKALIVDDHALYREALQAVVRELDEGSTILEAGSCAEAWEQMRAHPDLSLVLLDLSLPDGDGFTVLRDLRSSYPAVAVVVLSALRDQESVSRAIDMGALGYIPKSATRRVTLSALQLVLAGGLFIPPEILTPSAATSAKAGHDETQKHWVTPTDLRLTERQIEVIALMVKGMSNKAICRELDLAEATVKNHITAILKALKVENRTQAVVAVRELGWTLPGAMRR